MQRNNNEKNGQKNRGGCKLETLVKKQSDDRAGLTEDSTITITEEYTRNTYDVTIIGEIGRGGSCIVYKGCIHKHIEGEEVERIVILKELFPKALGIVRDEKEHKNLIIPENISDEIKSYRKRFARRFLAYSEYTRIPGTHSLPSAFVYGTANNTAYAILEPAGGRLLSNIAVDTLSLNKTAAIMEAVCRSIKKLHTKEKLYLDLKPHNILYETTDDGLQATAHLIDFDSVQSLSDIRQGKGSCPYTAYWCAPEQIPDKWDGRYKDPSVIGYHTDIYSVGAILFFLMTGYPPKEKDIQKIKNGTFAWEKQSTIREELSTETAAFVNEITGSMLEQDPVKRMNTYSDCFSIRDVEKTFTKLYGMSAGGSSHFEPIHGRISSIETEIGQLKKEISKLVRVVADS